MQRVWWRKRSRNTVTNKILIATIVITSFIAGTMISSGIIYAHADKQDKDPFLAIVNAIQNLQTTIQNKQTSVNVNVPPSQVQLVNQDHVTLLVAATKTGEVFIRGASGALFYGNTLCKILADGSDSLLLEFAGDTIVQNNNSSCPNIYGSSFIFLNGDTDATFHKGDKLILARNPGPNWEEVARQIS